VANTLQLNTFHGPPSDRLLEELRRRPGVLGVEQRSRSLAQIEKLLNQSIGTSLGILVLFCGGMAFGSVLNTALVSLGEREREVGTLRVLGYTNQEVWLIFTGESYLVNGLGVLTGLPGGVAFAKLISHVYNTELFRLPVIVDVGTLLVAAALMCFFITLAQLVVYRLVVRLRWLDVFKVRE
jgi:putative ABC transport system permease protein